MFLDLDGVLLTYQDCGIYSMPGFRWNFLCVNNFNQFVEEVNPIVIVSSNWRLHYSKQKLQQIFKTNGVKCEISGYTKKLSRGSLYNPITRGLEIHTWMEEHAVEGQPWCAIDDTKIFYDRSEDCDDFFLDKESINAIISEHTFITPDTIGFDVTAKNKLIEIINTAPPWK